MYDELFFTINFFYDISTGTHEEITATTKRVLKPVSWRFIEFGDFTKAQTKVRKCAKCRQSVLIADKQSVLIGGDYINNILKNLISFSLHHYFNLEHHHSTVVNINLSNEQ